MVLRRAAKQGLTNSVYILDIDPSLVALKEC